LDVGCWTGNTYMTYRPSRKIDKRVDSYNVRVLSTRARIRAAAVGHMELPQRLTLFPPGPRESVDEDRANEFIQCWNDEISQYDEALRSALGLSPADPIPERHRPLGPVGKISFSDKSYSAGAAATIASWLTRDRAETSPIASGVEIVDLSDVIASRPEDEALQVLQILCDAFKSANLVEVNLSDNALGSKGISACRSVLTGQVESLQRLSLCNNGLSAASMEEVADILTADADDGSDSGCAGENLTQIHFFNNMSGNGGCHAFARILSRCSDALRDVRFSGTRAGRDGSQVVASALAAMEDRARNIVRLDLADNTFGIEGARNLAKVLRQTTNLTYLNLAECMCEDEGIGLICHSLWAADAPIAEINLSGNEISKSGARSIAEYMEENSTIKIFCAEENELTSLGVKRLVTALAGSDQLEEIRLACNEIGSIGAAAIVEAHGPDGEGMPGLKSIHLDRNYFSEGSVEALRAALGDRLGAMEDNDEDEDIDDGLSDDEDEEEDEDEDEDDVGHVADADVDALTAQVAGATLEHDLT